MQKILEDRGIPYTGEGVEGSRTAFDKLLTKEKFREHNVAGFNQSVGQRINRKPFDSSGIRREHGDRRGCGFLARVSR